jgi:geranylgeranyl pyrophosphate synthase
LKITQNTGGEVSASPLHKKQNLSASEQMIEFSKEVKENCLDILKDSLKHKGFNSSLLQRLFLGKMTRSKIIYCIGKSKKISHQKMLTAASTVELLHEASLVHDDIQDKQKFRRGVTTIWHEYSVSEAISWGDFLLSASFNPLLQIESGYREDIINLNSTLQQMLEGQNIEQTSCGSKICKQKYIEVAELKTSALLELGIKLICSRNEDGYDKLLNACKSLGVSYQIQNDLNDFLEGETGIDYLNQVSSLPFLELYDLRKEADKNYSFQDIYKDEINEEESLYITKKLQNIIDQNIKSTFSIFSKELSDEYSELLIKIFRKYFSKVNL